jgi:hypothetical protein
MVTPNRKVHKLPKHRVSMVVLIAADRIRSGVATRLMPTALLESVPL